MNIWKNKRTRAWLITTSAVFALGLTVNLVAAVSPVNNLLQIVLGPSKAITKEGEVAYEKTTESKEEAKKKGEELNNTLCDEGIVLLKNDNKALPLAEGAKISVFGKNSANVVLSNSGSGGGSSKDAVSLKAALTQNGFAINEKLMSFYESKASGDGRSENPSMDSGGGYLVTGETPISSYSADIQQSYSEYSDAAIIVFSRIAGEGFDLPMTMEADANKHYLQLDENETALIKHVCEQNFKHVIIYLNSNNPLELGFLDDPNHYAYNSKIDGCIWAGGLGNVGSLALGRVLKGQVNPSGHLIDTYPRNFKEDPVWQNFGNNRVSGKKPGDVYMEGDYASKYFFVDYEEGIYVGYRYWETRGTSEGEEWYKNHVVYPFGYGLSYTTFTQEITNTSDLANAKMSDEAILFKVKVKNTGDVAGKEVVQVYADLPYTTGGIEKSTKVLAGFAKTDLLKPNQEQVVEVSVNPYYLASYDFDDKNKNDFKGFEIEAGAYSFEIGKNAHETIQSVSIQNLDANILFDKDPVTKTPVENLYDDAAVHLSQQLSRADWNGTYPVSPTADDKDLWYWEDEKNISFADMNADLSSYNPLETNPATEMPITNTVTKKIPYEEEVDGEKVTKERAMILRDMIGKDYDDEDWNDLLNQMPFEELEALNLNAAFKTNKADSIAKPETSETDGPSGFVNFMDTNTFYGTAKYCNETVIGATWNIPLTEQFGETVGEEGLWGDSEGKGKGLVYSGWYAPGANIHRGQFGGRVAEYFSEDPLLSGKMSAAVTKGALKKGVYTYMKHFALNEQETHRGGVNVWCNEQAIREIYLRPFEIAVKEAKATGIMSSFNKIGTKWTGGDYRLLTTILRKEWGFKGTVICDFSTGQSHMNAKQMAYAGGDLNLDSMESKWAKKDNASDVTVLRENAHHILYTIANSCVFNAEVIGYALPTWEVIMFWVDGAILALLAAWGIILVISERKKAGL